MRILISAFPGTGKSYEYISNLRFDRFIDSNKKDKNGK